jgi:hypothetical protein
LSHFTVSVITPARPSDEDVTAALQPFHEFECTGVEDEYVQDVDVTEDARKTYASETTRRYRDPQGALHDPYEDRFYRDPLPPEKPGMGSGSGGGISWHSKDWGDGRGYRPKVHFVPDGWEDIQVPTSDVEPFADWVAAYYGLERVLPGGRAKHGFVEVDTEGNVVRAINRTNPNKKWDWWTIGGRWSNLIRLKAGDSADQARIGDIDLSTRGNGHSEPFSTFAVLRDGKWFERGRMGWWAAVADEKPEDQWEAEFGRLLADDPDAWLTVVDCHI